MTALDYAVENGVLLLLLRAELLPCDAVHADIVEHLVTCGEPDPHRFGEKAHVVIQMAIARGVENSVLRKELKRVIPEIVFLPPPLVHIIVCYFV